MSTALVDLWIAKQQYQDAVDARAAELIRDLRIPPDEAIERAKAELRAVTRQAAG
jgi:hypothetical protein